MQGATDNKGRTGANTSLQVRAGPVMEIVVLSCVEFPSIPEHHPPRRQPSKAHSHHSRLLGFPVIRWCQLFGESVW